MTKEHHNFDLSGPSFLRSVEWNNPDHRRIICASLIQGVYVLEHERTHRQEAGNSMAPSWWESFNFKVKTKLVDDHDSSYYGVVYEFNDSNVANYDISHMPPRHVIAFRGTKVTKSNFVQDFKLNISFGSNTLHKRKRVMNAIEATKKVLDDRKGPHKQVWLAGHSLGSAIALVTGRHMVEESKANMETFLFNPPMISNPMEHLIHSETKKSIMRIFKGASTSMAYGLARLAGKNPREASDKLSSWTPHLFLNRQDPICAEYIGHFSHLKKTGLVFGNIAGRHSVRSLFLTALGRESCAYHLIPSADLTINSSESGTLEAHKLHQWWKPNLNLHSKIYKLKYDHAREKIDLLE